MFQKIIGINRDTGMEDFGFEFESFTQLDESVPYTKQHILKHNHRFMIQMDF